MPAESGVQVAVATYNRGIYLTVEAFTDTFDEIVATVLDLMINVKITADDFLVRHPAGCIWAATVMVGSLTWQMHVAADVSTFCAEAC